MQKKILFLLMVAICGSIYTGIDEGRLEKLKSIAYSNLESCVSVAKLYINQYQNSTCFASFYMGSCKFLCPSEDEPENFTCRKFRLIDGLLEVNVSEFSVNQSVRSYPEERLTNLTARTTTLLNYIFRNFYTVFAIKDRSFCQEKTITIHFENNSIMKWEERPGFNENEPVLTSNMTIEVRTPFGCQADFQILGTVPFLCRPKTMEIYTENKFPDCEEYNPSLSLSLCSQQRPATRSTIQPLTRSTLRSINTTDVINATTNAINTTTVAINTTTDVTNTTAITSTTTTDLTNTTATTTTTTDITSTTTTDLTNTTTTTTNITVTNTTATTETTTKMEIPNKSVGGTGKEVTSPSITAFQTESTSAMMNESLIPAVKNSTENETLCPCACYVETTEHFKKRMQETRKQLTVKLNETSRYIAKKISAKDDRPSSQAIGALTIVLFTVLVSVIIVPDISSLVRYLFLRM